MCECRDHAHRSTVLGELTQPGLVKADVLLNRNDEIEPPRMVDSAIQSVEERLNELMKLREKGLIDEQEYNRLRQKALGL